MGFDKVEPQDGAKVVEVAIGVSKGLAFVMQVRVRMVLMYGR